MTLHDAVVGASVLQTWQRAREKGWACTVRPSVYVEQVGLSCTDATEPASNLRYGFIRDQLVSATLEHSLVGAHAGCSEATLGFGGWAEATLAEHRKRFGPEQVAIRSDTGVETHTWWVIGEELSLRVDPERQRLSIGVTDTAGLHSLRLSEGEVAYLIDGLRGGERYGAMAEEVAHNLHGIVSAEVSYYSEFGHYFAAGPHPRDVPRGATVEWIDEEAVGFREVGFAPTLGRVSCSYAVGLGPQPCAAEACQTFTAVATCDPKGDGQLVHWGLVRRSHSGQSAPFGMCRAEGVYSPDSGELLGHNVVGLCDASDIAPR